MSLFVRLFESLSSAHTAMETFGRHGDRIQALSGGDFLRAVGALRPSFRGWDADGRKVVALLFKPEETVEFLVAALAAISEGFTIVPLYPNWPAETQLAYLRAYKLRALAFGEGMRARVEEWRHEDILRRIPVGVRPGPDAGNGGALREALPPEIPSSHPCAWIFTSGTSGKLAKLTEISFANLEAAIENIHGLDFLRPGMAVHCPLSASHIFAFVVILGLLTLRPRRLIFSDVQHLSRLPQSRIGKIDGMILIPIVLNRLRAAFYATLAAELDPQTAPAELRALARIPLRARTFLKGAVLRAEKALLRLEMGGRVSPAGWGRILVARRIFGKLLKTKLGSPWFVVVGGAKPSLEAMAFLEVMGIRCLQGWGMTETTGPLAVCRLGDRFKGAFGTCGTLFGSTRAYIDDGELVVEGPQIARGYHQPDGTFVPFHGKKRTGDHAEFDARGRLRVLGKASDRITTENGINYNPLAFEEEIRALDLEAGHRIEEVVVLGDGQPRLGAVFFLREGVVAGDDARVYLERLLGRLHGERPVDERIAAWTVSETPFREAGLLGPSGKLVRRRAEEAYVGIFEQLAELVS